MRKDENKGLVSKYAKNYLPIMFNLYTTETKLDDPFRQSIIDTVKFFLKISEPDLINVYLMQAIKNYEVYVKKYDEWLQDKEKENNATNSKHSSDSKQLTTTTTTKKVVFDFDKMETEKKSTKEEEMQPFLFAKYGFLDLIGVLAKYANTEVNIEAVCQLANLGINVRA